MPEPLPHPMPEAPKPESVVIGETPLYLKTPVTVGGKTISSFTVLGKDQRAGSGGGSAVILTREPSRKKENRGQLIEKENLNMDRMDTKNWDDITGIRFRDEAGNAVDIPKEQLRLSPSDVSPLSNLEEKPTITIVGLRAYEGRALDLADRSMQKLSRDLGTIIWKQSIGGIYFHERARQYYLDMLKAAETPFAEEAIRLAERKATDIYNDKLKNSNFLVRAGTKAVEWLKSAVGMRSAIQATALEIIGDMKARDEIKGMETLEREGAAVRKRFEQDFDRADKLVRTTLGEKKLELLDESDARNQPIVTGIKDMMKRYATGEIADKKALDQEAKTFFANTLKANRPDLIAEAELYTSSLFEAAENLRAKVSHEAGIANIDAALSNIQVKLGLAHMGEVTSLDPTAVERGIGKVRAVFEWLQKKNILVPLFLNETAIGSGLALFLSGVNFFKTMPAAAFGAGALAGGAFAGWREYGQIHKDYLAHLRERETGAKFTETQKRRQWFERFAPQQRSAAEMTKTIEDAMAAGDYRTAMATIADLQARKAVSETGPKRIGLVQYSSREAIESERTALDLAASNALSHLSDLRTLGDLLGENDFPQFMEKLTIVQTRVLREGVGVLTTMEDPVNATLNLVSQYAPEANLLKRRWPFSAGTEMKAAGMDAIMEEFKKEARLESVKYGVKAGVVGAAVGVAFHGIGEVFASRADVMQPPTATAPNTFAPDIAGASTKQIDLSYNDAHTFWLGNQKFELPDQLDIIASHEGPRDEFVTTYQAIFHLPGAGDVDFGSGLSAEELKTKLTQAGMAFEGLQSAPPDVVSAPVDVSLPSEAPTIDFGNNLPPIKGEDLGNGGIWDYYLGKTGDVSAANGMKNLFRIWEHQHGTDNITFGDDGSNPYNHAIRLRDATLGGETGKIDIDLTHIPNDARIVLPEKIFGDAAIKNFTIINHDAIVSYTNLINSGNNPMDAIDYLYNSKDPTEQLHGIVLKLGYLGQDNQLPTSSADLNLLYEKLGATVTTSGAETLNPAAAGSAAGAAAGGAAPVLHEAITETGKIVAANPDGAVTIPYAMREVGDLAFRPAVMEKLAQEQATLAASEFPWFPIFIPYRSVLEAAIGETAPASAEATAGKERKPQPIAVREYLDNLSEEEKQFLAGLDLPPVSPDLRAAVIIPVSPLHGSNVSGRLSSYLSQDAMNKTEFLVFDTLGVKEDVDTFLAEHPDMKVLYVAKPASAETASAGAVKRDATNVILSRISTMPEDSPDVAVVMDNGTGGQLQSTYLSGIIDAFDANPSIETVGGAYALPQEAYSGFPMLFARFRAVELMDAFIRHGEAGGIPPTYAGNLGVRAASLASVGGYKTDMAAGEDRILMQSIGNWQTLPAMTATFDPKDISYATLQSLNLADANTPLAQNETYKDMSWEDMAKRASDAYAKEHLEADLSKIYTIMPHDEYFKRTMDALGIQYEIKDGVVSVLSTDTLAQNMASPLDIEEFARADHEKTAREHLEKLAGDIPEPSTETPTESLSSSVSSPDLSAEVLTKADAPTSPESLPVGVEERMATSLKEATTPEASVQITPGELMDYLKSSIDINGTRITEGKIEIDGTAVKLTDITADVHRGAATLGDAKFSATLVTDPQKGLVVDRQSFTMQLPWTLKLFSGQIHQQLDNMNERILEHLNTRIDPSWQATRIDVAGEKLEVTFAKKA